VRGLTVQAETRTKHFKSKGRSLSSKKKLIGLAKKEGRRLRISYFFARGKGCGDSAGEEILEWQGGGRWLTGLFRHKFKLLEEESLVRTDMKKTDPGRIEAFCVPKVQ